jgi:hypothetical protein
MGVYYEEKCVSFFFWSSSSDFQTFSYNNKIYFRLLEKQHKKELREDEKLIKTQYMNKLRTMCVYFVKS